MKCDICKHEMEDISEEEIVFNLCDSCCDWIRKCKNKN